MPVQALLNLVKGRAARTHSVPEGQRIYAIGDIHGRLDLLENLLAAIEYDDASRSAAATTTIFLGDLVDRGPESAGVVERLRQFARSGVATRFLMGNHEEVFLSALRGDLRALRLLIRIGGRETLFSYGISQDQYRNLDFEDLASLLKEKVPAEHVEFLSSFERWVEIGDYLFVHAGLRPGIALVDQAPSDLRWIRDDFLRHRESFGKLVIHGHSITEGVDVRANRIGIDTGAYSSGRLTAIGLEMDSRWFLST